MNQLPMAAGEELGVNQRTRDLIVRGVSDNTLRVHQRVLKNLKAWMRDSGQMEKSGDAGAIRAGGTGGTGGGCPVQIREIRATSTSHNP